MGVTAVTSFDAFSQANLVGGVPAGTQAGYNPSAVIMSPRAYIIANDPFAGMEFMACQQRSLSKQVPGSDYKTMAGQMLGSAIGSAIGGAKGSDVANSAVLGIGGQYCEGEVVPVRVGLTCNDYRLGTNFDENAAKAAMRNIEQQQALATCKINNANRAADMAGCFGTEIDRLKDALREVKKDFDQQMNSMNQYESTVKAAIRAEDQKIETLDGKIASIDSTKEKIEGLLRKVNAGAKGEDTSTVGGLRKRLLSHNNQVEAFKVRKKREVTMRTASCIKGGGATTSSIRNCPSASGELMNPRDCILSIFRDQTALGLSGGSTRISNADQKKAQFATKQFEARLSQMLGDLEGNNPRTSSLESWMGRYQSELSRFGPAGQQIVAEVKACNQEAQSDVDKELVDPNLGLGQQANALSQTAETLHSDMGAMIGDLDIAIRDAGKEVYGDELNELVNGPGCNTAVVVSNKAQDSNQQDNNQQGGNQATTGKVSFQPVELSTQMKCVMGLNENLKSLLNGTPPPGSLLVIQVPLNVPGADGSPARCKGLRDCANVARKLQATAKQTKKNLEGDGTFKDARCPAGCPGLKKFHRDSNTQIRAALQQAADLFARRVAMMKFQFGRVRELMNQAGVNFPAQKVNQRPMDELCKVSEDAVCNLPGNFDEVLSGLASVPSLTAEEFNAAQTAGRDKATAIARQTANFGNELTTLKQLTYTCPRDDKLKLAQSLVADVQDEIQGALEQCSYNASQHLPALGDCLDRPSELQISLGEVCRTLKQSSTDPLQDTACKRARRQLAQYRQRCMTSCKAVVGDTQMRAPVTAVPGQQGDASAQGQK